MEPVVTTREPFRNTLYPLTPVLSVEAYQLTAISVEEATYTPNLPGTLGGWVSGFGLGLGLGVGDGLGFGVGIGDGLGVGDGLGLGDGLGVGLGLGLGDGDGLGVGLDFALTNMATVLESLNWPSVTVKVT